MTDAKTPETLRAWADALDWQPNPDPQVVRAHADAWEADIEYWMRRGRLSENEQAELRERAWRAEARVEALEGIGIAATRLAKALLTDMGDTPASPLVALAFVALQAALAAAGEVKHD